MLKPGSGPPPVVSVDIPSGWHVEKGDENGDGVLLSSMQRWHCSGILHSINFHYLQSGCPCRMRGDTRKCHVARRLLLSVHNGLHHLLLRTAGKANSVGAIRKGSRA